MTTIIFKFESLRTTDWHLFTILSYIPIYIYPFCVYKNIVNACINIYSYTHTSRIYINLLEQWQICKKKKIENALNSIRWCCFVLVVLFASMHKGNRFSVVHSMHSIELLRAATKSEECMANDMRARARYSSFFKLPLRFQKRICAHRSTHEYSTSVRRSRRMHNAYTRLHIWIYTHLKEWIDGVHNSYTFIYTILYT